MPEKVNEGSKVGVMSWVKTKKKEAVNLDQFEDVDEDSVLQDLTEDEIKELDEAIDPEVRKTFGSDQDWCYSVGLNLLGVFHQFSAYFNVLK